MGESFVVLQLGNAVPAIRVAAHFMRRSENGSGQDGRDYWRARFVCDPTGAASGSCLARALANEPLRGWTPSDRAEPILAQVESARVDCQSEQLAAEIARLIEHGSSAGIVAPFDASRFFALASQVEQRLSAPLRPLFGIGWNVSRERTADFALSCAPQFSRNVVTYDPSLARWGQSPAGAAKVEPSLDRETSPADATVLRFSGAITQQAIHSHARRRAAERRYRAVQRWLDGPEDEDTEPLHDPCEASEVEGLIALALSFLESGGHASRAERVILLLLERHSSKAIIEQLRRASGPNARALTSVLTKNALALVQALHATECAPPPWTRAHMKEVLDRTFERGADVATAHADLLCARTRVLAEYADWLAANGARLALVLASRAPEARRRDALECLQAYTDQAEVALILALCFDAPPAHVTVDPVRKELFRQLALRRWRARRPADEPEQEQVRAWMRVLDVEQRVPILSVRRPTETDVEEIASELRVGHVHGELLEQLAERMIKFWPVFAPFVRLDVATWHAALELWPGDLLALLLPATLRSGSFAHRCEILRDKVVYSLDDLEAIGLTASLQGAFAGEGGASATQLYVCWCGRMIVAPRAVGLAACVYWLWHDADVELPEFESPPKNVAALREISHFQGPSQSRLDRLWGGIRTRSQALLLLQLFGRPVHALSAASLQVLLSIEPDVLADVLLTLATPAYPDPLALCSYGWQALDIDERAGAERWEAQFEGTLVSGLFRGLPHSLEAPFGSLLEFYERRSGTDRWLLAHEYLQQRGNRSAADGTKDMIWRELVERACLDAGLSLTEFCALALFAEKERQNGVMCSNQERETRHFERSGSQILLSPRVARLLEELAERSRFGPRVESYRDASIERSRRSDALDAAT
jgi:hypothetical protein